MIKTLLLIFEPVMTWDDIAQARRSAAWVLAFFLLPLLVITLGGELAGLEHFGKAGVYLGKPLMFGGRLKVSTNLLILYGAAQLLTSLILVAASARLIQSIAHTFHSRHTYSQCFSLAAYSLGPMFLLRLCDAAPSMHPWASFAIGIVLTVATLYHGVPKVLEPDPPHAFGLYLCSMFVLAGLGAMARFITILVLSEKIHF